MSAAVDVECLPATAPGVAARPPGVAARPPGVVVRTTTRAYTTKSGELKKYTWSYETTRKRCNNPSDDDIDAVLSRIAAGASAKAACVDAHVSLSSFYEALAARCAAQFASVAHAVTENDSGSD